ncbi:hypothetical protein O9993_00845 [Vibrio lentus]|nr:hypothetical protein [Vibrio lentus]
MAAKGDDSHSGHFIQACCDTIGDALQRSFLGTAVAYALGAGFLGLGYLYRTRHWAMSAPWLIFALFEATKLLPPPGAWMFKVSWYSACDVSSPVCGCNKPAGPFIGKFPNHLVVTVYRRFSAI